MMIHTALVAKQSPALEALVSGSMEEAKTKTVLWKDVDEETFGMFAQFVYTGDYKPPSHTVEEAPRRKESKAHLERDEFARAEEPAPEPAVVDDSITWAVPAEAEVVLTPSLTYGSDAWGFGGGKKSKKGWKQRSVSPTPKALRVKFQDLQYALPEASTATTPRANASETENYTPVFLGHARLYAFAEKYDIPPLRSLVLHKLHLTLKMFSPYEERSADVVELARYVYANTPSRIPMEPLRKMVVQYIAEAKQVAGSKECMALVREGKDFASDLLGMVLETAFYKFGYP